MSHFSNDHQSFPYELIHFHFRRIYGQLLLGRKRWKSKLRDDSELRVGTTPFRFLVAIVYGRGTVREREREREKDERGVREASNASYFFREDFVNINLIESKKRVPKFPLSCLHHHNDAHSLSHASLFPTPLSPSDCVSKLIQIDGGDFRSR